MPISSVRLAAILGIGISLFALSLFVIKMPVRTIAIFFAIGTALTILWLWAESRQNRPANEPRTGPLCVCDRCKHQDQQDCYHDDCACCVIKEGERIVGHRPHPLA